MGWSSMSSLRRRIPHPLPKLLALLTNILLIKAVAAQDFAVSATAAWSSQIVAFWGALIVGVRASDRSLVANAITSFTGSITVYRRSARICGALKRQDWYLHSGWVHGRTRMDVVMICWRTPEDLRRLALQVAMQLEVLGDYWEVLVVGRQLKGGEVPRAHWMQSPRCAGFSAARITETNQVYFPLTGEQINDAVGTLHSSKDVIDAVAADMLLCREKRSSRCAIVAEVRQEVQQEQTPARIVTSYGGGEGDTPLVQWEGKTAQFGSARRIGLKCAASMYAVMHTAVAVAIGLMGAASGRGLAIWVMTVRPTLLELGTKAVAGNNVIFSLLGLDDVVLEYETQDGSDVLAGDMTVYGLSTWRFICGAVLPLLEFALVAGGWVYGALRVQKLRPSGVVGHGMLWLAVMVALSLSFRSILGVRKRIYGRLIGIFITHEYSRFTIGGSVSIPVKPLMTLASYPQLGIITALLQECKDDRTAIVAASGVLRHPDTCTLLAQYVVTEILNCKYSGDVLVSIGDPPRAVSSAVVYPWIQAGVCILMTMCCACVSVAYAYFPLPIWVKPILEALLLLSAVWFTTLERTSGLEHSRDSYVSHMVATMVVSAVWYVGVRDVG